MLLIRVGGEINIIIIIIIIRREGDGKKERTKEGRKEGENERKHVVGGEGKGGGK